MYISFYKNEQIISYFRLLFFLLTLFLLLSQHLQTKCIGIYMVVLIVVDQVIDQVQDCNDVSNTYGKPLGGPTFMV